MLQEPQYLTYKTQNIPFISFMQYVLPCRQVMFDCGFGNMKV